MKKHIYETGLIGNCSYLAHVHKNTNVVWMCWPRFDSDFIFGGLLDSKKGGEFSILPADEYTSKQYYLENTNVLCTEISCGSGRYRILDFAPRFFQYDRFFKPLMLIRKIEVLEGNPRINVKCKPVGNYGEKELEMLPGSNHIKYMGSDEKIRLTSNIPVSYLLLEDHYFLLNETKYLLLSYGDTFDAPLISTAERFLTETIHCWRLWIKHSTISSFHQPHVIRSAITLKIHQYEDTGAIIAASTTSLPESHNSGRNWDYRYCWLRDTYYVISALNHIGHFEEMEKYFGFVNDISVSEDLRYQPLYSITGQRNLKETTINLEGYLGNQPVRIGNQAAEHIQNDIYGQVMISLLPLYVDYRYIYRERNDSDKWITYVLDKIERTIDEKDAGIWEFRNIANIHCYSNLFQWAGCSAAAKMARTIGNATLEERALVLQKKAAYHIESCYDPIRKVYTIAAGSKYLDASTLQLIMMHYLDPTSDRAKDHLKALEVELKTPKGLFYRYLHEDDFGKPKTTFLICAFWYVEALASVGRIDDAVREFENLLQYANHLLLFSEDVDEETGSQWGNFPQTYSHVGLMNAAYRIATKLDRPLFV